VVAARQHASEEAEYKAWREHGDRVSFTGLHGPMYVRRKSRTAAARLQRLRLVRHADPRLVGHPQAKLVGRSRPIQVHSGTVIAFHI